MYPGTDIYALGTDETMSFYALQSQKEEDEEPAPKVFGDVREVLGCEYLVGMHWIGTQPFVAAGKHRYVFCKQNGGIMLKLTMNDSESHLSLIPITKTSTGPLDYAYDLSKAIQYPGAHGEEIVRDLFTDVHVSHTSFTAFFPLTPLRHEQHIRAAKMGTSAHGNYPRTIAWRLTMRPSLRRRRKRAAIEKRRERTRRIRKRVRRRDSSLIELSDAERSKPVFKAHLKISAARSMV
jgi:hypothetical protein